MSITESATSVGTIEILVAVVLSLVFFILSSLISKSTSETLNVESILYSRFLSMKSSRLDLSGTLTFETLSLSIMFKVPSSYDVFILKISLSIESFILKACSPFPHERLNLVQSVSELSVYNFIIEFEGKSFSILCMGPCFDDLKINSPAPKSATSPAPTKYEAIIRRIICQKWSF